MSDWNGLPDQPERSGTFHILRHKKNRSLVKMRYIFWGGSRWLKANSHWHEAAEAAELFDYVTPVISSSELAQMRKDERERCLTIAVDEQWNFPSNPSIQTPEATVAYNACQRIIDKIRNVGDAL